MLHEAPHLVLTSGEKTAIIRKNGKGGEQVEIEHLPTA